MRTIATTLGLLAVLVGAAAFGQTVNICDRTPQVQDAIRAEIEPWNNPHFKDWDGCTVDARGPNSPLPQWEFTQSLADITRLEVKPERPRGAVDDTWRLTALQAGDFAGLTSLKFLKLRRGKLTDLPPDVFAGLTSLETLDLGGNEELGLARSDPHFAGFSGKVRIRLPPIKSGEYRPGTRSSQKVTVSPIRETKE